MAGPIYGKVDCYSESADFNVLVDPIRVNHEMYVGLYNFMLTLQANSVVDLVALHTGTLASGTPGVGYWDSLNPAGSSSFAVWRWKANVGRPWDWYMYMHLMHGVTTSTNINSSPTFFDNGTTTDTGTGGILLSYAIAASGSSYANPWNGTTNTSGSAAKGFPVWSTGALNHTCYAFPRNNALSGSRTADRAMCDLITNIWSNSGATRRTSLRYHFLADSDGIMILSDYNRGTSTIDDYMWPLFDTYQATYAGAFDLGSAISLSNPGQTLGGGSKGFICISSRNSLDTTEKKTNVFSLYTNHGALTLGTNKVQGGVLAALPQGVRTVQMSNRGWQGNYITDISYHPGMQPNPWANGRWTSIPVMIASYEAAGFQGVLGWINTPIFRLVNGIHNMSVQGDGQQAVFGGTQDPGAAKLIVPWSGSRPGTNFTRAGRTFTYPAGG